MRFKLISTLLLLNLIVFYTIYKINHQNSEKNTLNSKIGILGIPLSDINEIEIKSIDKDQSYRVIRQSNNDWIVTSPINWSANLFAIQRILTQLQFIEPEIMFPVEEIENSGQSLKDYGLDTPNLTLSFKDHLHTYDFLIGKATNLGNRIYALSTDKKNILVIKQFLLDSLSISISELINQQIFTIPFFELNTLSVQLLSPHNLKIRLAKKNNQWNFEAPILTHANSTLVDNAINQLSAINVERFLNHDEKDLAQTGLLTPNMRVTLLGINQRQTLIIGNLDESEPETTVFYAKLEDNPTVFTVSATPFAALKDAQEALREKRFIKFSPELITDLSINQSNTSVNLQKLESGEWNILQNEPQRQTTSLSADSNIIVQITDALRNLEAMEFISDAPSSSDLELFGFNDPQRNIHILGTDFNTTLIIGNLDSKTNLLYAKIKNAPFVYKINPSILSIIPVSTMHYQNRTIDALPKGSIIKSLSLVDLNTHEKLFKKSFDLNSDAWEKSPQSLSNSQEDFIKSIASDLKNFKVRSFLENSFKDKIDLDKETTLPWSYSLVAEVVLPGSNSSETKSYEFYFTKRLSGKLQIGGSPDLKNTFTLEQDWIDHLSSFITAKNADAQASPETANGKSIER